MATYAIGDVQGCYDSLRRLLDKIQFTPEKDTVWFAGDLVNRGPQSLETLRFIKSLNHSSQVILGNHDISLIAMHYGALDSKPSLKPILQADDRDELIHWLQQQPLLHVDHDLKVCLCHAGIYPKWTQPKAQQYAKEVETIIRHQTDPLWYQAIYGNSPSKWSSKLQGIKRHRFIINAFTRMRYVMKKKSQLEFNNKIAHSSDNTLHPWFKHPKRKPIPYRIVFGHWASLGFFNNKTVTAIDTGCVWSNQLTAIRLEGKTPVRISIDCL